MQTSNTDPFILRRLAHQSNNPRRTIDNLENNSRTGRQTRYNDKLGKIRYQTRTIIRTSGSEIRSESLSSIPNYRSLVKNSDLGSVPQKVQNDNSQSIPIFPGNTESCNRHDSLGQITSTSTLILSETQWRAHSDQLNKVINLNDLFFGQLKWWEDQNNTNRGQALHSYKAQLPVLTDASTQSWGGGGPPDL